MRHLGKLRFISEQYQKERKYWENKLNFVFEKTEISTLGENSKREQSFFNETSLIQSEVSEWWQRLSNNNDKLINVIFVCALSIVLKKLTGLNNIILGIPIYKQQLNEDDLINKIIPLNIDISDNNSFKELLGKVKETLQSDLEHQNYPVELMPEFLGMETKDLLDFPLFDIAVLYENIQCKSYLNDININLIIKLKEESSKFFIEAEFNGNKYKKELIQELLNQVGRLLNIIRADINIKISEICFYGKKFEAFENQVSGYSNVATLFDKIVERFPNKNAVTFSINLYDILEDIYNNKHLSEDTLKKLSQCSFIKNPYLLKHNFSSEFILVKNHFGNLILIDDKLEEFLDKFNSNTSLSQFYSTNNFSGKVFKYSIIKSNDLLEIGHTFSDEINEIEIQSKLDFYFLVKELIRFNLLHLNNYQFTKENYEEFNLNQKINLKKKDTKACQYSNNEDSLNIIEKDILIFGDSMGLGSVGILYLASYLKRKGIKVKCQIIDDAEDFNCLKENIFKLLRKHNPRIVAISLKWFTYISKVIELAKCIKLYSNESKKNIDIVLGGNTASYFAKDLISFEFIDYIIKGDGEIPLFQLSSNAPLNQIPNLIYKTNGKIYENEISYVQDEANGEEIFLSNLNDLLSDKVKLFNGSFFIFTSKGCDKNCFYCGGNTNVQKTCFNRNRLIERGINSVRKDIKEIKKFVSALHFDFNLKSTSLYDYCESIFQGIDLTSKYCILGTYTLPDERTLSLLSKSFKYIYYDLDVTSFSESHRDLLQQKKLIKKLPSDDEIFRFLYVAQKFSNIEIRFNSIIGLPFFTQEDIGRSKDFLFKVSQEFTNIGPLHCGRLHAQPGAPIFKHIHELGMNTIVNDSFNDYYVFGFKNFSDETFINNFDELNYPYIYYNSEEKNIETSKFYTEISNVFDRITKYRQHRLIFSTSINYKDLKEKAIRLASFLQDKKLSKGDIVGLFFENSVEMIQGMISVLYSGAVFLPIDPEQPYNRVRRIINDSQASFIISQKKFIKTLNNLLWDCNSIKAYVCIDTENINDVDEYEKSELMNSEIWNSFDDENDIKSGGWKSSFTNELFSDSEMKEYVENVYLKINHLLTKDSKVLEIGCSSGLTMFRIHPYVKEYYAIDISDKIIERNLKKISANQIRNINLFTLAAHEIDQLNVQDFDLIIINSVLQSFHGHNYLNKVMKKCISLCKSNAHIFWGDVMDNDLKNKMIHELKLFKSQNNYSTKIDFSNELFLSKGFCYNLKNTYHEISEINISDKFYTIENELTKYRYDVIFTIEKNNKLKINDQEKIIKQQYDLSHIANTNKNVLREYYSINPDDIAYLIYTSGSTGDPKGTLICNKNLQNYISWAIDELGLTENDKSILLTLYSYDLGYTSIFPTLCAGSELHIIPKDDYINSEKLLQYSRTKNITYLKLTPSLFKNIVNSSLLQTMTINNIKYVIFGGEPIDINDAQLLFEYNKSLKIINHYGPTETTIGCITERIDKNCLRYYSEESIIGRPIRNTKAYIMNSNSEFLPEYFTGELCISGDGVSKGYLNQPELNSAKFLMLDSSNNEILYRTGDKAFINKDKKIVFLGRIDSQRKIRGQRIELSEIENTIKKIQGVNDAKVILKNNTLESELIAFYTLSKNINTKKVDQKLILSETDLIALNEINIDFDEDNIMNLLEMQFKSFGNKAAIHLDNKKISYQELNYLSDNIAHAISNRFSEVFPLTSDELIRYKRQLLLSDWTIELQEKLKALKVFVAGAGGGASPTITQLALMGVGHIIVCDYDVVELSNLNRQFLHNDSRIGVNKALSAKKYINDLNPNVNVIAITEKLTRDNVGNFVGDSDVIFDMFDSPEYKFILSEYSVEKQIPHIISAMIDLNSYCAIFYPGVTACFHCVFDKNKISDLTSGMKEIQSHYEKKPLPVVATSLFISSGFIINELIKITAKIDYSSLNKFFYFNQRQTDNKLLRSESFIAMTLGFTEIFLHSSAKQGYNWKKGWQGKSVEEIKLNKDPECINCGSSKKNNAYSENLNTLNFIPSQYHPVEPIGIFLDDDIKLIAAVMGVLKDSGIYCCIDPRNSDEIILQIFQTNNLKYILSDRNCKRKLVDLSTRVGYKIDIIDVDELPTDKYFNKSHQVRNSYQFLLLQHNTEILGRYISSSDLYRYFKSGNHLLDSLDNIDIRVFAIFSFILKGETFNGIKNLRKGILPHEIKRELKEFLPDYMIPKSITLLDSMPLTKNGKTDVKYLETIETNKSGKENSKIFDRDESALAEIWSDVLKLNKNQIENNSNFFELGGHSLKITSLISKINNQFNIRIPINEIFRNPSFLKMMDYIKKNLSIHKRKFPTAEKKNYYRASQPQETIYSIQNFDRKSIAYNMHEIVCLDNHPDVKKLYKIFNLLIDRHESLRTSFALIDKKLVQIIHDHVHLNIFEITANKSDLESTIKNFLQPFELEKAPLFRIGLIKSDDNNFLIVDFHHIIVDGISMFHISREFLTLYYGGAIVNNEYQYKDFSEWSNSKAHKKRLNDQKEYWLKQLIRENQELKLPIDDIKGKNHEVLKRGSSERFSISGEKYKMILEFCKSENISPFVFFIGCLNILFFKTGGNRDIIIGSIIAGRDHSEFEKVVGNFVNMVALRNYPEGSKTIIQFIKDVNHTVTGAIRNSGYRFELLINELKRKRKLGENSLLDVGLTYHDFNLKEEIQEGIRDAQITLKNETLSSRLKLNIDIFNSSSVFNINIEFDTSIFLVSTIQELFSHYCKIVDQVVTDREITLDSIPGKFKRTQDSAKEEISIQFGI